MKKELFRFTLCSLIAYFTVGTLNPAAAATQPSGENGAHYCGVTDAHSNKQLSDQFPNRHYARTLAANLNVGEPRTVRLIYFLPNDRAPQKDINAEMDRLIKDVQQSYAEVMENHGFGRKTFRLETDSDGKVVVHHVNGRFPDAYYHTGTYDKVVREETSEQFDPTKNIYLVVLDVSNGAIDGYCGQGTSDGPEGGVVLIPAPNSRLQRKRGWSCFNVAVAAHELGHAFEIAHDRLRNAKRSPSSYHSDWMVTSFCAAEWLDVHRYFNIDQTYPEEDELTTIQMLPPLASPPNAIRLRFEITDADRLQQAQLFWIDNVIACKRLNGQSDVYEFELIPTLHGNPNDILLRVIDVHGNFTEQWYPINIAALLPPPKVVSIPDANLATAIREELNLAPGDAFTQWNLLKLISLNAENRQIADLTGLEHATQLQDLTLSGNQINDISPLAGMTNLTELDLWENQIMDISVLTELTNLRGLHLWGNQVMDISVLAGLTNLTDLELPFNSISDLSPLVANTGLGSGDKVYVQGNPLSYLSIHTHIPTLQSRGVTVEFDNRTPRPPLKVSGDDQWGTPDAALEHPFIVEVRDQKGEVFAGVPVTFAITAGGGTLSATSTTTDENGRARSTLTLGSDAGTNTISVSAAGIEGLVTFQAISNIPFIEYILSIPAGISLIHVPLKVTAVDGVPKTITSIGDLYDVLGSADTVNFLITYDSKTQGWLSYFGATDKGTSADVALTDDKGIIVGLRTPVSIQLRGDPLGTNGSSAITLNQGLNLVGLPLRDLRIARVSDLFALEGIGGNVPVIILTDDGAFKSVGRARDPGDIPIIGGQSFIMTAQRAATVAISGEGWYNVSEVAAGPPLMAQMGIEVGDTTPVLALRGSITSPVDGWGKMPHLRSGSGFRVIVKNLSTGRAVAAVTKDENLSRTDRGESMGGGYQGTIVDVETGRAARIGDILEVSVRSPDPLIGVQPLRYTVTAEDVKRGLIQLTELVAYKIPTETELLPNYPNPFNPETWIPYRLAEDAFVTLTIYDQIGHVVRTLDVGHRIASAYESRSKAVYWDGNNGLGEGVASGIYFYTLTAGDYSATRKMVILK